MNRRKKIFFILLVVLAIGLYFNQKNRDADNLLNLDNVEALASGEEGHHGGCYYAGTTDCLGAKADYSGHSR